LDSTAFKGLADKLPEDVMFIGRLTSPPTFDSSWQERYTPILGMKRFLTWKWHGYHPNSSIPWRTHLLYDGPKYKQRAMTLADLGQLGLANGGYQNNDPCTELSMLAAKKIAWDPYRFDPTAYLSEWAEKKFGAKAGKHVTNALKDSWKVIDAFVFFERPTQTCHIMNFVPRQNSGFYRIGCVGKQPAAVANVTQKTLPDLLKRFDIKEAVDIAQSAEVELDKAHELRPNDKYLKKLWMLGKATPGLAKFWRGHHLSIIYNNMSAQSKGKEKKRYSELARSYSQESMEGAKKYLHWLYELYPLTKKAFDMGNGVVGWKGAFTPPSGPTICTPTFYAHGRMASVFHQAQNGYNRLVMEDRRKKHHPYLLWQLNNTQPKIDFKNGAKLSVPLRWVNLLPALQKKWGRPKYDIDLDQTSSSELPTLISPYIMPSLNIQFSGNLKDGGMLALKHRPLGGWETPRDAEFDIAVDGKKIGVIHDLACRDAIRFPEVDFIRYLEIPPLNGTRHKLTISASRGYGSELYFLRLYTPVKETRYPTAGIEPNPFMTNSPPSGRKAIRLEAEKFKTRNKVSTIDNPNASGGKMILFKKRDSFLESEITLDPGTYYLNIRGLADNSDEDGFSCLIAGEKMNLYFQDYKILTDSGITPFSVRKGGTQKIRIVPRDIRFKIDFVEIR
jgi:hypothetical protein